MKHNYYAIYDRVAELYGPLNEMPNDNTARRSFLEACKGADGYKQHPQDMEIHRIGSFDDINGTFSPNKEILEKGTPNDER